MTKRLLSSLILVICCFSQTPPGGMVLIPGGRYCIGTDSTEFSSLLEMGKKVPHISMTHVKWWYGDEYPRHEVELDSFYMDSREVSNRDFRKFVRITGYQAQGNWQDLDTEGREDHPVVNVSWYDAKAYAAWAGKRLPTEEEWEVAAAGGLEHPSFAWGDDIDPARANIRWQGERFGQGLWRLIFGRKNGTKICGSYPPNGYGLYDLTGNVSEWVDSDHADYEGGFGEAYMYKQFGPWSKDSQAARHGKVVRGGSWDDPNPVFVRISDRSGRNPTSWSQRIGFRCVRDKFFESDDQ